MDKVVQGELSYSEVKKLQKQSQERINKLNEKREHLAKKLSTMGSEADRQKKASIERIAIVGGVLRDELIHIIHNQTIKNFAPKVVEGVNRLKNWSK